MKRRQVVAQRRRRPTQPKLQPSALNSAALDRACSGQYPRTLLTMQEAAEYLRFLNLRGADHCREFLHKHGVKLLLRGRDYLVRVSALDDFLETGQGQVDVAAARTAQALAAPTVAASAGQ